MDKQLSQKLSPALTAERLERQWRGIEARTRRAAWRSTFGSFRPLYAGFALAAVTALVIVVALSRAQAPEAVAGGTFDNPGQAPASLKLPDGSQVQVSPAGRVEFQSLSSQDVRLLLTHGTVELDVTHVEGRRFVVQAGDIDVIVRGTHFRVELADADPKVVSVSVQRGQVEVRQRSLGTAVRLLSAGMSWTMGQRESAAAAPPSADAVLPAPPTREPEVDGEPPSDAAVGHKGELKSAKQLLEQADAARLAGHPREAAAALDELVHRFRSDPRAGLAALQLGRLCLDSLHNPRRALEAFRDAATLSASSSVQEDALARQVQAQEALGNQVGCENARDRYLSRYPSGIHSASIARRCGGK